MIVPDGAPRVAADAGKGVGSELRLSYHRSMRIVSNPRHRDETRLADDLGAAGRAVQEGRANE